MRNLYPRTATLFVCLASTVLFVACSKTYPDGVDRNIYTIWNDTLRAQEVPLSQAQSKISGRYLAADNQLEYRIEWKGLSSESNGIHFHGPATAGNPEGIYHVEITANGTTGFAEGIVTFAEVEEEALVTRNWYYDIHSNGFENGELRQFIILSPY